MKPERHIYVHVPFCLKKCRYCNFFSVPHTEPLARDYFHALAAEFRQRIPPQVKPQTIYIGGGTPTALPSRELSELMKLLQGHFDLSETEEFTIEANPGTLSPEKVAILKDSAANRISLGVQSFSNAKLEMLGRIHTSDEAATAFESLADAGFRNISIDLIYGVPGDSEESWLNDLDRTTVLKTQHVSAYCLSVESGTPFEEMLARGELALPDDKLQRRLYEMTASHLQTNGYERYELSNFALPGFSCRHNLATWRYEPYTGLGPAAASFDGSARSRNPANIGKYLAEPGRPSETEILTGQQQAREVLMLALRTREGITGEEFKARCSLDLHETFGLITDKLVEGGHLEAIQRAGTTAFRIADDSLFVSDEILSEFF